MSTDQRSGREEQEARAAQAAPQSPDDLLASLLFADPWAEPDDGQTAHAEAEAALERERDSQGAHEGAEEEEDDIRRRIQDEEETRQARAAALTAEEEASYDDALAQWRVEQAALAPREGELRLFHEDAVLEDRELAAALSEGHDDASLVDDEDAMAWERDAEGELLDDLLFGEERRPGRGDPADPFDER